MEEQHAFLSPSAAGRWLNCTAAPAIERTFDDRGSDFAREGTLAHAYAALALRERWGMTDGEEWQRLHDDIGALAEYRTPEMLEYAEGYAACVTAVAAMLRRADPATRLFVEHVVDIDGKGLCWGTADAFAVGNGVAHVFDFKYGRGVAVEAAENPQMMLYAMGIDRLFADTVHAPKVYTLHIIQPRNGGQSEWSIAAKDLREWYKTSVLPRIAEAAQGGTATPGGWCRWCKAAGVCRKLSRTAVKAIAANADRFQSLSDADIAALYARLPLMKAFVSGLEAIAMQRAKQQRLPGFVLEQTQGRRVWKNAALAADTLKSLGYCDSDIYKSVEMLTPAQIHKALGKDAIAAVEDCVERMPRATRIVPQDKAASTLLTFEDLEEQLLIN